MRYSCVEAGVVLMVIVGNADGGFGEHPIGVAIFGRCDVSVSRAQDLAHAIIVIDDDCTGTALATGIGNGISTEAACQKVGGEDDVLRMLGIPLEKEQVGRTQLVQVRTAALSRYPVQNNAL
jgi:hypothetical protein